MLLHLLELGLPSTAPVATASAPLSHEPPPEKVLQRWAAQGHDVLPLATVGPEEIAIVNSLITAAGADNRGRWLLEVGNDLQEIPHERLKQLRDGRYMVEVKKAFRAGRLDSPAQVAAWTHVAGLL